MTCEEAPRRATDPEIRLSRREKEILALVAQGASDNEIAMQLCLSAKTVSWYVRRIRTRLGAHSRAHAVALAMQQGLLAEGAPSEPDS
jgi:DNA-binding CsgD family transcriptional regulator